MNSKCRLHRCDRAVDGTLVRIRTPAIVDWHGFQSVHDAAVWRNSAPAAAINREVTVAGYCLLGDMGYGNGGGLTTPFRPTTVQGDARKMRYNRDHCRMRSIVETVSRLKSRFSIHSSELRVGPERASKIVIFAPPATRQLGSRKATMAHPGADVAHVRAYIVERM
ncbi:hypothetical protein OSTOST_01283 [Ostertagia ostertagi]